MPRLQPKPKGPFPAPESYERLSWGPKPARPGPVAMGTLNEPVPVAGLAANFSPMPRIAPPPLGRDNEGALTRLEPAPASSALFAEFCVTKCASFVPLAYPAVPATNCGKRGLGGIADHGSKG